MKLESLRQTSSHVLCHSLEADLANDAIEILAVRLGNLELDLAWLARAVSTAECASAPRRACFVIVVSKTAEP